MSQSKSSLSAHFRNLICDYSCMYYHFTIFSSLSRRECNTSLQLISAAPFNNKKNSYNIFENSFAIISDKCLSTMYICMYILTHRYLVTYKHTYIHYYVHLKSIIDNKSNSSRTELKNGSDGQSVVQPLLNSSHALHKHANISH